MQKKIIIPSLKPHCEIKSVGIFGSADVDAKHPLYQEVFKVARYLAYNGYAVVDGGGPGTMEAATLGAESVGGQTIAVTFEPVNMPGFEGRASSNVVDLEIKTGNYIERMFGLIERSDVMICFQGGTGTLSEWATSWLMSHLYQGNHKPIILYGEFWHDVMRVINDNFFISQEERDIYKIVKNQEETKQAIEEFKKELLERCQIPNKT